MKFTRDRFGVGCEISSRESTQASAETTAKAGTTVAVGSCTGSGDGDDFLSSIDLGQKLFSSSSCSSLLPCS